MTENAQAATERTDDRTERVEIDDGVTLNAVDFAEQLRKVANAVERLDELQTTVEDMNTGLTEEDAIRLIYGRTGFSLSEIRDLFDTLDTIAGASDKKLLRRLLSSLGNSTLDSADEFIAEVDRLEQRYGHLADDDGGNA